MRILFVSLAVVIADQVSKFYIKGISVPFLNIHLNGISPGIKYPLAGNNVIITLVENPGIGFGLNPGENFKTIVTLFTLLLTAGLILYFYFSRKHTPMKRTALALLIGGAAGNLIDRLFYGVLHGYAPFFHGNVVDFINIRLAGLIPVKNLIGSYVFNVADIAVSAGIILMMLSIQLTSIEKNKKLAAENQE